MHGDVCPWNLLIDPSTDNIQLFDFNMAAKLGWEGDEENNLEFQYDADRSDVKFVIFTTYELITREFNFRQKFYPEELDASEIMEQETWEQHPDSKLDSPVDEYRRLLVEWVETRAQADQKIDHFTKASLYQGIAAARVAAAARGRPIPERGRDPAQEKGQDARGHDHAGEGLFALATPTHILHAAPAGPASRCYRGGG